MARGRGVASGPDGASVLRKVKEVIAAGFRPGLTVLTGDDLYHLDAAQRAILEHLVPPGDSGFALSVLGDERISVDALVSAARSSAMFAAARIVLLRDVSLLEGEPDALTSYAGNPPASSYLLVRAPKLDRKRKLHKALATAGTTFAFRAVSRPDALLRVIRDLASERDLRLDRDAAALLAEVAAGDLYRVVTELDKLRSFVAGSKRGTVDATVVREVVAGGEVLSGWEVANAIADRDPRRALAAARRLLDAGDEPLRMLGGLAWKARRMLESGARGYAREELLAFPARLLAADRALKSSGGPPRAVFETLVQDLAGRKRS